MGKAFDEKIKKLLQEIEDNNHKKIIVYSLDGCPACEEYKYKLNKLGVTYESVEMEGNQKMWSKLKSMGGSEYVPQTQVENYLIKENEYDSVNDLISQTLSRLIERKIVIK